MTQNMYSPALPRQQLPPSNGRSFSPSPYGGRSPLHNSSPRMSPGYTSQNQMSYRHNQDTNGYVNRGSPRPEGWSTEPPSHNIPGAPSGPSPYFTLANASTMLPSMFNGSNAHPGLPGLPGMGTFNEVYAEANNSYNPWRGGDALFGNTQDDDYDYNNEWMKSLNKIKEKVFSSIADSVTAHVFNDMPINVVRAHDMKLISREDLKRDTIKQIIGRLKGEPDDGWDALAEAIREIKDTEVVVQALLKSYVKTATKYAILSHRWGADELTYATLKNTYGPDTHVTPQLADSEGYIKVSEFIQAAQAYGCPYVWFDTGCIDKSSSSEVEESIRSMFTWYRKAEVCLVYLADSSASILGDEWFTRGWTLQELLAPSRIKFFGAEWVPLTRLKYDIDRLSEEVIEHGSPKFIQDLMKASGILNTDRLINFSPGITYAREVFHWASQRRTTRPEDLAYCLFGLLGLQLPVAYGEGFQSAFFRLQVELVQRSEDRGLFFWSGLPSSGNSMLAANMAGFRDPVPWSDEGVRVDRIYTSCLDKDPTISMTNCGIRMVIPKYPVILNSVPSSYQTATGCVYKLRLWVPDLQCVAVVSIQLAHDPIARKAFIADAWSIGLLGTAFIARQGYSTFVPVLLERASGSPSQRYRRLFTDRFLLDIEITADLRLKDPEVIYVK